MMGASLLTLTVWWIRKPGSASFMGLIATILNLMLRLGATHFLGFTAACIVFDVITWGIGYRRSLEARIVGSLILVCVSVLSTLLAGIIIGSFFMNPTAIINMFGGVLFFIAIHGVGGLIGGILGVVIVRGLEARSVTPYTSSFK